ncbi:MAG TPA: cytochrome c oxidase assembly protein [Candidatus Limnocylindrales bacterium]
MAGPVLTQRLVAVVATLGVATVFAAPVIAHGLVPNSAPTLSTLLFDWTLEPLPTLGIAAATGWWLWAVRRVNASHPANPVPRSRTIAFLAAMAALAFALVSGIARYDTWLFSVHMVQHVLLMLVAAPLIAMAAPITLILRLASGSTRRRWILPFLNSRVVRFLTFPVTDWIIFSGVLWASHFSPLFNAALEDPSVHYLEHALFLTAALLFWWPAVGMDPAPWRMGHPVRIVHVFLQMTQNTFLAVVILNVPTVLYPHYATLVRSWGPSGIDDQRLAAGIMWLAGDLIFLTAIMVLVAGWMRAEGRTTARADRQAEIDLARIRVREQRLAERLASERGDPRA